MMKRERRAKDKEMAVATRRCAQLGKKTNPRRKLYDGKSRTTTATDDADDDEYEDEDEDEDEDDDDDDDVVVVHSL